MRPQGKEDWGWLSRCSCAGRGVTSDQYDAVMAELELDANPAGRATSCMSRP